MRKGLQRNFERELLLMSAIKGGIPKVAGRQTTPLFAIVSGRIGIARPSQRMWFLSHGVCVSCIDPSHVM